MVYRKKADGQEKWPAPDAFVGYTITRLSHVLERRIEHALSPTGLNVRQFGVLAHLATTPGLGSAEIARLVLVTPQSMSALVDTLVQRGLVLREAVAQNGIKVGLRLTAGGEAKLGQGYRLVQEEQAIIARVIGERELTDLNTVLHRLLAAAQA